MLSLIQRFIKSRYALIGLIFIFTMSILLYFIYKENRVFLTYTVCSGFGPGRSDIKVYLNGRYELTYSQESITFKPKGAGKLTYLILVDIFKIRQPNDFKPRSEYDVTHRYVGKLSESEMKDFIHFVVVENDFFNISDFQVLGGYDSSLITIRVDYKGKSCTKGGYEPSGNGYKNIKHRIDQMISDLQAGAGKDK